MRSISQSRSAAITYLQYTLREISVVLFCDLCPVSGTLEDGRVVVDILHVNHYDRVVFLQVVRRSQLQLVLRIEYPVCHWQRSLCAAE